MKKYIKHIIILLLVLGVTQADAQQNAVMTHYTVNPYLYNVAQVGESGYTTLSAHYRKQWTYMPDAPDTKLFSGQTMIKNKFGIGAKFYYDQVHIIKNFGALFSYAYYIRLKENTNDNYLSVGISAGFKSQKISFESSTIKDPNDPNINETGSLNTVFDAEAGISYRREGLKVGLFASNIAPDSYDYKNNITGMEFKPAYHFYGSIGYDFALGESKNFTLKPLVLARYIPNVPFQFDGNLTVDYKDQFWIGAGYRYNNAGMWGLAGFRVHDLVAFTYSYEQSINSYQDPFGPTNEVTVEFRFKPKKDDSKLAEEFDKKIKNVRDDLVKKNINLIDSLQEAKNRLDELEKRSDEQIKKDISENSSTVQYNGRTVKYFNSGVVTFNVNSATLFDSQKSEAQLVFDNIAAIDGEIVMIRIEGSASIEGSETYNLFLSNKRTFAMKNFLVKKGIKEDLIATSSKGNSEALVRQSAKDDDGSINTKDRHVRVFVLFNEKGNK